MEIIVNHQNYSVPTACSVQHVLEIVIAQPTKGIAVAVNHEIIAKHDWETYVLNPSDKLTIIKATQGG